MDWHCGRRIHRCGLGRVRSGCLHVGVGSDCVFTKRIAHRLHSYLLYTQLHFGPHALAVSLPLTLVPLLSLTPPCLSLVARLTSHSATLSIGRVVRYSLPPVLVTSIFHSLYLHPTSTETLLTASPLDELDSGHRTLDNHDAPHLVHLPIQPLGLP